MANAVVFERVRKSYGSTTVIPNLNLEIPEGSITVLVGPSGCGKTTTMKMINRLISPTSGTITVGGRNSAEVDPVALRRSIGYVIQQVGLFPHLTIAENISLVPRLQGEKGRLITKRSIACSIWSAWPPTGTGTDTRPSSPEASSSG